MSEAGGDAPPFSIAPYAPAHRDACLALFDANCPKFFAPNERADFAGFLERLGHLYFVFHRDGAVVGAFGVTAAPALNQRRLSWIMLSPTHHGAGLGRVMLEDAIERARAAGAEALDIGASHLSAPFFARFGATEVRTTPDGWGPGMHRVDMVLVF